jgi:SMC interacting uncharacterized protein involved in chromosome segregation
MKRGTKMKKILSLIMVAAMIGTMSVSAFAATTDTQSKLEQRIVKLQDRQQKISDSKTKNEQNQAKLAVKQTTDVFKQALIAKRQIVLKNRDGNLTEVATINQLRLNLAQSLDTIKKSGSTLPKETASQIKADQSQIKQIMDTINQTKGQIKTITEQDKTNIQNKDAVAMEAAYDQIASIQTSRHEQLAQISDLLQKINTLVENSSVSSSSSSSVNS